MGSPAFILSRLAAVGLAVLALTAFAPSGRARADSDPAGPVWIGTWGASPQTNVGGSSATAPSFTNQTIRQVARISTGGTRFRVRLSNEFGTEAVEIGDARLAISAGAAAIKTGTDRVLTFSGRPTVTIPPGAPVLSDPVDLDAPNLTSLAVSLYLPQATGPATSHVDGKQRAFIAAGDLAGAADVSARATTTTKRFFLTGIDVATEPHKNAAIVTLGDSITDGASSTRDADHRWPDFLANRLAGASGDATGVVNEGISGNRLLHDVVGPDARSRFDRDVLETPGVRFMTVLLGINDIGSATGLFPTQAVTADDIIAAHRQLIARAHSRGIRIYGCTLTPFGGVPSYFTAAGEAVRNTVNDFIRNSAEYDAVIDFDAVMRDPANPSRMLPAFDSGDHLHPSDAGYQAMANAIDLRLFKLDGNQTPRD